MKILSFIHETSLRFSEPVTDHSFVLQCLPKTMPGQIVLSTQIITDPRIALDEQVDGFGNILRVGYCPSAHEVFDFHAAGLVMVDWADVEACEANPLYLQPSRFCKPSEEMIAFAKDIKERMPEADNLTLAKALCMAVFNNFEYVPGSTGTQTTAAEAFAMKQGVCQDFAHVLITLCRICDIPTRYVNGLMVGEGATHAWACIHDGVRWRGIDPTHNCEVNDNYLVFSTGRDFGDCPIERGVFRGNAEQTQTVFTIVEAKDEADSDLTRL